MNNDLLITFASWEERFLLGSQETLSKHEIGQVLVFYLKAYSGRTRNNREGVAEYCTEEGIDCNFTPLSVDEPARAWKAVVNSVTEALGQSNQRNVLLDISTMPRETIWHICWTLKVNDCIAQYLYFSPEDYAEDWISRDPQTPRIVYKLGGVSRPGQKTALVLTIGFDPDRAARIVGWLEPAKLLFGIQAESPFRQNQERMEGYRRSLKEGYDCETFELDSFGDDCGQSAIEDAIEPFVNTHNIMMTSLGPKLTAISLFKINRKFESTSLVYAPANEFNDNYSKGIGSMYTGIVA